MKEISFIKPIFFGNYFYGLCAVALSIEALMQQGFSINPIAYFVFVFFATVIYYTKAYISQQPFDAANQRTRWYKRNYLLIRNSQIVYALVCVVLFLLFIVSYYEEICRVSIFNWILIFSFPFMAFLYYGINSRSFGRYNLRNVGWLKPFVIGFVWAGLVTIYPIVYYSITHKILIGWTLYGGVLFIKNFMFVTVLCIMFDIKDYTTDSNQSLKTFVVKVGLRRTIFYILIPLIIAGLSVFIFYGIMHQFSLAKIIINTIPFILMLSFSYLLRRRKSILFYLIMIDGLMLVKAACGIIATTYF